MVSPRRFFCHQPLCSAGRRSFISTANGRPYCERTLASTEEGLGPSHLMTATVWNKLLVLVDLIIHQG